MKTKIFFCLICVIYCSNVFGQSTWQKVYTIFQSIGTIDSVDFVATPMANAYTSIFDQPTANTFAQSKGYKRIDPGYPHRSFLFRKINNGLDMDIVLDTAEGGNVGVLTDYQKELVRQWIMFGAPQTGNVVDTSVIYTYYTVGGIHKPFLPLPAPDPSLGFQLHFGTFFLNPGEEIEFFLKYDPRLPADIEVNRVEIAMAEDSHHMVLYKFHTPAKASKHDNGIRIGDSLRSHGDADIVTASGGAPSDDKTLPPGTAYKFESSAIFDINYHILNSSPDSVLAYEVYFNFYTQPIGTAASYMESRFFLNMDIPILWDTLTQDSTSFEVVANDTNMSNQSNTHYWNIWILYSHTHRYGVDYDIWLRNPDGTKGEQVYEGFMDFTHTVNTGYYDWELTPQRIYDTLLVVDPRLGFIHKAVYKNTMGPATVNWGLTTQDEMMVMGFQYTLGDTLLPLNVKSIEGSGNPGMQIYPNPFSATTTIYIPNESKNPLNAELRIYDLFGREVQRIINIKDEYLKIKRGKLGNGMYFCTLYDDERVIGKGKILIE